MYIDTFNRQPENLGVYKILNRATHGKQVEGWMMPSSEESTARLMRGEIGELIQETYSNVLMRRQKSDSASVSSEAYKDAQEKNYVSKIGVLQEED